MSRASPSPRRRTRPATSRSYASSEGRRRTSAPAPRAQGRRVPVQLPGSARGHRGPRSSRERQEQRCCPPTHARAPPTVVGVSVRIAASAAPASSVLPAMRPRVTTRVVAATTPTQVPARRPLVLGSRRKRLVDCPFRLSAHSMRSLVAAVRRRVQQRRPSRCSGRGDDPVRRHLRGTRGAFPVRTDGRFPAVGSGCRVGCLRPLRATCPPAA